MGTFGEARGTIGACRADFVILARFVVVVDVGVLVPLVAVPGPFGRSTSEESGVVGREVVVLNDGRRREVREGDGGSGVGGLL